MLEANSIINNMGVFLRDELGLDPDAYCYPSLINHTHKWDSKSRTCITCIGTFMTDLVGDTEDLHIKDKEVNNEVAKEVEMTSKDGREFRRIVGLDDTEKITDMKKKRKPKTKIPSQVTGDARSVRSELSGLTNYSSSTKASLQRKELRATVENQQEAIADKDDEIEKLRAALLKAQQNTEPLTDTTSHNKKGTDISEKLQEGFEEDDISYSDSNEDTNTKNKELAEYPKVKLEGFYDVHNCVMYPRDKYVEEAYLDEKMKYPVHNPTGEDTTWIDPH